MNCGHLFSGPKRCGGLTIGFEQAGIETAWELDIVNGDDITKTDPRDLPTTDILAGGPPQTERLAEVPRALPWRASDRSVRE